MAEGGAKSGGAAGNGSAKFVTGDLKAHVIAMASAGSVGLMGIFLVDLADLYFISLLGQTELAAAIGYASTVLFVTISLALGMAIAIGALVSQSLGRGDVERARKWATHGLAVSAAVSVAVGVLIAATAPVWVSLLGATGETADLAAGFLAIVAPAMPFTALVSKVGTPSWL